QDYPLLGDALLQQGPPLGACLHEYQVRFSCQIDKGGAQKSTAHPVDGGARISQVKEGRQEKRYTQAPRKPQRAGDWPGVGKGTRMNYVECAFGPAGITPHLPRDRIAGKRQALPAPVRHKGQGLEKIAPTWRSPQPIASDKHAVFPRLTSRKTLRLF